MSPIHPPACLPRAYLGIWKALRDADDRATSRQALATQLGVSTHTIQRILVRGDVPSFDGRESTRVLHSWVRSLSRIAARLGADPRGWIEGVGIDWSEEIAEISAGAANARSPRRSSSSRTPSSEHTQGATLHVALVPRTPFNEDLPEFGTSFLETLTRRLLGAIDPSADPRVEVVHGIDLADRRSLMSRFDLVAGLPETTAGRASGLWFVPIPGLRSRLDAVGTSRRSAAAPPLRWSAWAATTCAAPVLAVAGSASHTYLSGPSGVSRSRIHVIANGDTRSIVGTFLEDARKSPDGAAVLLLDDSSTATAVTAIAREMIPELPAQESDRTFFPMEDAALAPAFPICFAGHQDSPVSPEILRSAIACELLGAGALQTAQIYAALSAHFMLPMEDFREATAAFRLAVCDGLVSLVRPPEYARTLIPLSWQAHLDAALRGEPEPIRPAVSIHQCQSCSASLDDGVHGGVSDRYCRFCSDEQGQLRPREQVQGILARWLQGWQEGLSDTEATQRAASFMRTMPAWSHN